MRSPAGIVSGGQMLALVSGRLRELRLVVYIAQSEMNKLSSGTGELG